jgi:plasmid rolling circle replication initiator protein Rep
MSYTTTTTICCQLDILTDRAATGRERPWREHKVSNDYLAKAYDDVDPAKAVRLRDCATSLSFDVSADGSKRLATANFCRVRLCPMCQWRRGLKLFGQATQIMQAMGDKWRYIFLTLTVRNCTGNDLDSTLTHVLQSWSRMTRTQAWRTSIQGGYMRSLEVTHNLEDNTYHPHIHAILAVKPSYFQGGKYISQDQWTAMWADAARLDYTPVVHVQRCKGTSPEAIAEVAKYAVKVGDYLIADDWQLTVDTVRLLDRVLAGRRFVSFGGQLAATKRQLGLDNIDDGDLIHVEPDQDKPDKAHRVYYSWASGYNQYIRDM